jgi:hypothetical protein
MQRIRQIVNPRGLLFLERGIHERPVFGWGDGVTAHHEDSGTYHPIERDEFQRVWDRIDLPVLKMDATGTWIWGPGAHSHVLIEEYDEGDEGVFPPVHASYAVFAIDPLESTTGPDGIARFTVTGVSSAPEKPLLRWRNLRSIVRLRRPVWTS